MVVRLAVLLLVVSVSCSGSSTGAPPTLKPQAIPSGPLAPALRANLDGIFGDPVLLSEKGTSQRSVRRETYARRGRSSTCFASTKDK